MDTDSRPTDEGIELPTDFAEHMASLTGLDTPPATMEELWAVTRDQYSENDLTVGLDDLYSETPTPHEVQVDGRVRYTYCALDALMAAVIEEQTSVTVRSIDPVTEVPVTITVSDDAVDVSPEGALICYGSDIDPADVEAVGSLAAWSVQDDKDEIQTSVCQYTNAFENEATYEKWASQTESLTASLPPKKIVPLLRKLPSKHS